MTIQQDIQATLKQAMRDKNRPLLNLVRMLKTKMMEQTTKSGFDSEVDDALWLKVITTLRSRNAKRKPNMKDWVTLVRRHWLKLRKSSNFYKGGCLSERPKRKLVNGSMTRSVNWGMRRAFIKVD